MLIENPRISAVNAALSLQHVVCTCTKGISLDQYDRDHVHVDYAEIEAARAKGPQQLLETILNYAGGSAFDILRAAQQNGSPVILEGQEISEDIIESAFSSPTP